MRHTNLRPTTTQSIRAAAPAAAGATRPHGIKRMGKGEDTLWENDEGVEHSVREIPAALEQLTADLASGISTTSRMNTVSTSAPGPAKGYAENAIWTRVEMDDGQLIEAERWIVHGGLWEPVGLDASRLLVGTVDAGLIDAVALAARLITAGLIRTAATGQRVEMTSDGLVLWLVDEDGLEYQAVRIGPTGATLLTVGDVTVAPGSVTAPVVNTGALTVGGRPLGDLLAPAPRGVVGYAYTVLASAWDGTGLEVIRLQAEAMLQPGRRYSVTVDPHYVGLRSAGSVTTFAELLRYELTGDRVTTSSTQMTSTRSFLQASTAEQTVPPIVGWMDTSGPGFGAEPRRCYVALSTRSAGGRDVRLVGTATSPVFITIRDEGPALPATGRSWMDVGTPSEGAAAAPPAVAEKRSYTSTYKATSSTTYWSSSGKVYEENGDVIQGSYTGGAAERRHGSWWFPSMTGDLAGATIQSAAIWVKNRSTWASAGGSGHFYAHAGGTAAGANFMNASFTPGQERWLNIDPQYFDALKNGTFRGFMAYSTTTAQSDYARFYGGNGSAAISINYTK